MTNTQLLSISLLFIIGISFLLGVDTGLKDKQDRANLVRYCGTQYANETLCKGMM